MKLIGQAVSALCKFCGCMFYLHSSQQILSKHQSVSFTWRQQIRGGGKWGSLHSCVITKVASRSFRPEVRSPTLHGTTYLYLEKLVFDTWIRRSRCGYIATTTHFDFFNGHKHFLLTCNMSNSVTQAVKPTRLKKAP